MKDLIIKVEGKVLSNNITEFESDALAILNGMSTDLVTDDDFSKAEDDIKLCKEIEIRLDNVKQDIIHQSADVSEVVTKISQLFSKFRETRLTQEKLVKKEKLTRKNEIIQQAIKEVKDAVSLSPVAFAFTVDETAISEATKRKSSLEKMVEAIGWVVLEEYERLKQMAWLFEENTEKIEETEKVFPGLFPDKKQIALEPVETVEARIEARINKFKLELAEKKQREEEAEKRKLRDIEARKQQEEEAEKRKLRDIEARKQQEESDKLQAMEKKPVEDNKRDDAILHEVPEETKDYTLTISIHGRRIEALSISEQVVTVLEGIDAVMGIEIKET